jgi:hypothetical protein
MVSSRFQLPVALGGTAMNVGERMDAAAFAAIRKRKDDERRKRKLPMPNAEAMQERFLRKLLKYAIRDAIQLLSSDDRKIIRMVVMRRSHTVQDIAEGRRVAIDEIEQRLASSLMQIGMFLKDVPVVQAYRECSREP